MLENITKDIVIPHACPVQTAQEFCYHVIMKKIGLVGKHKEIESEMSIALKKIGLTNSNENEMICSETRIAYQKIVDLIYNDIYKLDKDDIQTISNALQVLPIDEIVKILKYIKDEQIVKIVECFDDNELIARISEGFSHTHRILRSFKNLKKVALVLKHIDQQKAKMFLLTIDQNKSDKIRNI